MSVEVDEIFNTKSQICDEVVYTENSWSVDTPAILDTANHIRESQKATAGESETQTETIPVNMPDIPNRKWVSFIFSIYFWNFQ